jgi:ABC-type transport system involved in multi-copper enzyme maturation permease subunit
MIDIIRSDFFRLRKGATAKLTVLGVCAFLTAMALIMLLLSSGVFTRILESSSEFAMFNASETGRTQVDDLYTAMNETPKNGAEFARVFVGAGLLPFFLLPLMLAVFAADYSAGTYRNTLSYETRRGRVYWAKLLTSIISFVLLFVVSLVFATLVGSVLFGFGGFSLEYVGWLLTTVLLQLPIYLGMICAIHFLIAFTQKSSTTIAVFLLVLLLFPSVVQLLTFLLPTFGWLANFDLLGGLGAVAGYATAAPINIILPVTLGGALAIASTSAGMYRYMKTDFV